MRNQSVRLYLYSAIAIAALTLVWGLRAVPKQAELAEQTIRGSVEQELLTMAGAGKAGVQALRYQLLDLLKAEGNERPTRTFQNSHFVAVTLLEWDQAAWKTQWHSSKIKTQFQIGDIRTWMIEWPLAKLNGEESFFTKVGDWQGQPYFAVAVPVRRPSNTPMIGIGIFPANRFPLVIGADRQRDAKLFDEKGFALALARPAYLGSNLKKESLVDEALESGEAQVRHEFKNAKGERQFGAAARIAGTNLYAAVESSLSPAIPYKLSSWLYLVLAAVGAFGLNWYLFFTYNRPVLVQLKEQESVIQQLRKRLSEAPQTVPVTAAVADEWQAEGLPAPNLSGKDFVGEELPAPALLKTLTLQKVVHAALRSLSGRLQEFNIQVAERGGLANIPVATDALQLQTAIEEILKNGIEAMQFSNERWLTITGGVRDGRAVLSIEDTGTGIARDNLRKVFDPFFSTKDSQGVARGLGLNVARRVIEEMKGKVTIDSHRTETSSGTTVEMEWPLPAEAATGQTVEAPAAAPAVAQATAAKPASPPNPMVAEPKSLTQEQADELLSDLDLLADEYEIGGGARDWPAIEIRKPIVRSVD